MKAFLLAAFLVATVLAGCSQGPAITTTTTEAPVAPQRFTPPFDTMPEGAGHDHSDESAHQFLWNYNFTARDPLLSNAADIAGLHAMDLQEGYLFGAIYGSHGFQVDGGVQIWDVKTDPAHPQQTGRWTIPGSVGGDRSIGATSDAQFVVIGTEPVDCLGHVNPTGPAASAYLIDARDKTRPVVADVITVSGGSLGDPTANNPRTSTHSVFVAAIDGVDYAFIFGDIYRINRGEAASATLSFVSTFNVGHDMYVRTTPWNTTWALVANGGTPNEGQHGIVIYNITDPTRPMQIGQWDLPDDEDPGHYFHTADVAFLDDQVIVVLASEDFGPHVSPFWVLDGNALAGVGSESDAVDLVPLGEWHNPYNHTAANIRFSLHNQRMHDDGMMTISSYHAGFFQFDLRHPEFWTEPSYIAAGAYADGPPPALSDPVEQTIENNLCGLGVTVDAPMYMDVSVGPHGVLYLADVFMGLYTFVPSADHPVYGSKLANPL